MADDNPRLTSVRQGRLLAGPETLQINLSNRCNLDCIFCWNHSPLLTPRSAGWHAERLTDHHLDNVIASLPKLKPQQALLSGRGEPLLHPAVERLLLALQQQMIPVTIQTNGIAGPSPRRLTALGVRRLLVNLSAATNKAYERTHPGRGDMLDRVLGRLEQLARLPGAPKVSLIAVIQRTNQDQLMPIVELAGRLGANVFFKGFEQIEGLGSLALDKVASARLLDQLSTAQIAATELGLCMDAKHLEQVLRSAVGSGNATRSFTPDLGAGPCFMGWYYLRVTCDGRVMFCCKDKLVGHLDEASLYRIWRRPAYHLLRLTGRDGDVGAGLFDHKCRACSNFARNQQIASLL